jgi:hypothetical protein
MLTQFSFLTLNRVSYRTRIIILRNLNPSTSNNFFQVDIMALPTGRYQSQLLNTLNRQTQRFKDQAGIWLRQMQMGALWSTQIALYPVYALFQVSRMATRQFGQRLQQRLGPVLSAVIRPSSTIAPNPLTANALGRSATIAPTGLISDRPGLIAPLRHFYQLMAWVQRGPIAHRLNCFDESSLITAPSQAWFYPNRNRWLNFDAINRNDPGHAVPSQAPHPIAQIIAAAIHYFFGQPPSPLKSATDGGLIVDDPSPDAWVETLLWVETVDAERVDAEWVDAERAESDARIRPIAGTQASVAAISASTASKTTTLALAASSWWTSVAGFMRRTVLRLAGKSIAALPTTPTVPTIAATSTDAASVNLTWQNVFSSDPTTTWLEVASRDAGYVQHPIERVLGWLDRGLAWLEQRLVGLWQWLIQHVT